MSDVQPPLYGPWIIADKIPHSRLCLAASPETRFNQRSSRKRRQSRKRNFAQFQSSSGIAFIICERSLGPKRRRRQNIQTLKDCNSYLSCDCPSPRQQLPQATGKPARKRLVDRVSFFVSSGKQCHVYGRKNAGHCLPI